MNVFCQRAKNESSKASRWFYVFFSHTNGCLKVDKVTEKKRVSQCSLIPYRALEEEVFNTAMSLAERYDVSKWEMLMTHLECLFSDGK